MNPALRDSGAHVFVADVDLPVLSTEDAHHLSRVLRLRDGEPVTCSDGHGSWRECAWSDGTIRAVGEVVTEPLPSPTLTVAVAPVKGDRTDLVMEKLVEIGVDAISVLAPVERSVVRWSADKTQQVMDRYARIIRAAAMQSRRVHLPVLTGPVPLATMLVSGAAVAEPGGDAEWTGVTTVVIGPEGGFSPSEIESATICVDLGPSILRAETAAMVAAARMVAHRGR